LPVVATLSDEQTTAAMERAVDRLRAKRGHLQRLTTMPSPAAVVAVDADGWAEVGVIVDAVFDPFRSRVPCLISQDLERACHSPRPCPSTAASGGRMPPPGTGEASWAAARGPTASRSATSRFATVSTAGPAW